MKVHDLTLPVSEKIPTFPGSPAPHFIEWDSLEQDDYNLEMIFLSTHTGTHIDAPYHFVKSGKKIHELDPSRFLQNAILIRIKSKPNYSITKSDIIQFEKKYGKIPNGATIIFATGWNDNLSRNDFFANPGLSESAAKYLVSKRANLVGIDSPSIDAGNNSKFAAHHVLLKNNVLILENLCNLSKLNRNFNLVALPLNLKNATGSPVRAIAF
ncbi:MAG: cyclase family protein [Thaumarchaeota archaeon]|nr:cyclase family protein [Nitrososphaerota archaeon]